MKKLFLTAILLAGLTLTSFAQSSAAFKYQAVARNASQEVYANQTLALRFSIILDAGSGSGDGTVVYSETHQDTETSPLGVFALNIGQGQVLSGNWEDIDWQNGYYFLKVDMDADNGTSYTNVGKSPLLSVPFALHAATVTDKDDADADPNNELQSITLNGTEISLSNGNTVDLASIIPPGGTDDQVLTLTGNILQIEGGNSIDLSALAGSGGTDDQELTLNGTVLQIEGGNSIDLAPLQDGVNDADADPSNEIQNLTLNGTNLEIENGNIIDLSALQDGVNDADFDPSNELQSITLNGTEISLSNGNTVDLASLQDGVNDADADPNNELQNLILNGNTLTIENGNNVDLSALTASEVWTQDAQNIYYNAGRVGIGTDNPNYALHIENTLLSSGIYLDGSENGQAQQRMTVAEDAFSSSSFLINARNEADTASVFALAYENFNPLFNTQIDFLNFNTNRLFPTHLGTQAAVNSILDIRGSSGTGFQDSPRLQFTYDNNMPASREFIEQSVSTFGDSVSMNWTQNAQEYGPLPLSGQAQLMHLTTHPLFGNELEVTGNIRGFNGRFTEAGGAILEDVVAVVANQAPYAIHADHAGSAPGTFVAGFHGSAQAGGLELSADSGTALKVESFGSGAAMTATGGNVGIENTDPGALLTVGDNPSRFFIQPAVTISNEFGGALYVGNDEDAVVIERNTESIMSISAESADLGNFNQESLLLKTNNLQVSRSDVPANDFALSVYQGNFGLSLYNFGNSNDEEWEFYNSNTGDLVFYFDGAYKGEISAVDGVYTPSDRKFKDQIRSIGMVLPSLMQLKVNRYRYIHGNETNKQSLGLIAQEVQEIFPELVKEVTREGFDSNLTMNYSGFGVIAVKAIQEQQQIIDRQEERIEDLEARLLRLEELLKK